MQNDPLRFINSLLGSEIVTKDGKRRLKFISIKKYSAQDLDVSIKEQQVILPTVYLRFLSEVGACDLYVDYDVSSASGRFISQIRSFMQVEDLLEYNRMISPDLVSNLSNFIVVGSDLGNYYFAFNLTREDKNFGIFTVDDYVEEWHSRENGWYDFDNWLTLLVEKEGKIPT